MSPKNARLETNGDQNSSARIRTDATIGLQKVSYQFGSEAEASPQFLYGYASSRWLDCRGFKLVSLLFGNHFVVELLRPRRERRARMIVAVKFEIFNLLSTNLLSISEAEASPQFLYGYASSRWLDCRGYKKNQKRRLVLSFLYGICFVVMAGLLRVLRFLDLLFNIVNGKMKLWQDFVPSSLVFHNKMLLQERYKRIESEAEASPQFPFWNMLRHAGWTVVDSNAFVTIFGGILKDHEMLISKEYKRVQYQKRRLVLSSFMDMPRRAGWTVADINLLCNFEKHLMIWEDYLQVISREFNETRSRNACLIPFQNQTSIRFTNALQQPHALLNDISIDKDQKRRLVLSSFMDMLRRAGWTVADLDLY